MARTSKTVIKGASPGAQATAARARATEDAQRETDAAESRGARYEGQIERGIQQTAGAVQQQIERGKERDFRAGEAEKDRVLRRDQMAQQQGQQQQEMQQRGDLAREQMDLRAAEQGLQRNPELDRRQAEVNAEMERGAKQYQSPSELDGQTWVPTEQRTSERERELGIKEMRAKTEQSRVEAMRQNAITRARSAARKGDDENYEAARKDYAGHVKRLSQRAERIIKSGTDPRVSVSQDDVNYLRKMAENNTDPELQKEIESGQLGPASARFLRGRMIHDSLEFVMERGDWPDPDLIDEAHPIYQQFQSEVVRAGEILRQRQQVGAVAGVQSLAEANRMKRRIAAIVMREKAMRQRNYAEQQGGQGEQLPGPTGGGGGAAPGNAPIPPTLPAPPTPSKTKRRRNTLGG